MQQIDTLSDKYEDQCTRLQEAMITLFKYENLLKNEYLVRKFEQDPFNLNWFYLPYEVVQRENSIKSQYVQNEQNNRKQYHLILTKILNEHTGKLWNYDQQMLHIRPLFPTERKRVQIKVLVAQIVKLKENIQGFVSEELTFEEQPYQADKSYVKLFVTTITEDQAQKLFTWLMARRQDFTMDSVMMMNIDYLEEFHRQIAQKKYEMMQNRKAEYQQQQTVNTPFYREEQDYDVNYQKIKGRGGKGRGFNNYRNDQNDDNREQRDQREQRPEGFRDDRDRQDRTRGRGDRRGGNRQNNQYVQKSEAQQERYHLVPKNVLQRTPKQTPKTMNSHDFPTLDGITNPYILLEQKM